MRYLPTAGPSGGARTRAAAGLGRAGVMASVLACTLMLVGVALPDSALALSQRGHTFSFSYGSKGKGEGQFSDPVAVAVSEATGEVYVADRKNRDVVRLESALNSNGELVGEKYAGSFDVPTPTGIAVDNSTSSSRGDVYVAAADRVYRFTSTGTSVGEPIKSFVLQGTATKEKLEGIVGVAVDQAGALFVSQEDGLVYEFAGGNAAEGRLVVETELAGTPGLALDSEDNLLLGTVGAGLFPVISKFEGITGKVLIGAFDEEESTGVAVDTDDVPNNDVDELNDAYVANGASVAQFAPEADGVPGGLLQRFPSHTEEEAHGGPILVQSGGVAVDGQTGTVFVTDTGADDLAVFGLQPYAPPAVESVAAQAGQPPVAGDELLSAQVDPDGADTHYFFEYGSESCAAATCASSGAVDLGEGFADKQASFELRGLTPGVYHYRVIAENSRGRVVSAEHAFTLLSVVSGLPDGRAWELVSPPEAHSGHIQALTREGGLILAAEDGDALTYLMTGVIGEEEQANRSPEMQQELATRSPGGWTSQDIATPTAKEQGADIGQGPEYEFFSADLSLGLVDPYQSVTGPSEPPLAPGAAQRTLYLRADRPIASDAAEQRSYSEAEANAAFLAPGYLPVVGEANVAPGTQYGGETEFEGATSDLGHIVLRSGIGLTGAGSAAGLYEWSAGGQLTYVSELPAEAGLAATPAPEAQLGHDGDVVAGAISNDGTRVAWSAPVTNPHLYLTDTATGKTIRIDKAEGVQEPTQGGAYFQSASPDGSRVLFTSTEALAEGSTAEANTGAEDLYVCEVSEQGGEPACNLEDLTAGVMTPGERAAVQGVTGASEDGAYVYFVAQGVLARNESQSGETAQAGRDNLYELHYDSAQARWTTTFIATLSSEDHPDWAGSSNQANTAFLTARVSPNGRYLVFMSERSLTGYDNEDVSSEHQGERLDQEVYLYDADTATLTCVSCNATGTRPTGVLDKAESGEGFGLLADGRGAWTGHWLAGSIPGWTAQSITRALVQSRYLSNEGRLFFDSADPLVPGIQAPTRAETVESKTLQVGVENVYEYEPGSVGSCTSPSGCVSLVSSGTSEHESAFLEATPSGDDVFFLTSASLVAQGTEGVPAIYDARVCTEASPCLTSSALPATTCESLASCRPASPGQALSQPSTSTATLLGPGNDVAPAKQAVKGVVAHSKPLTRAQKLAKALNACQKRYRHSKRRRKACDARARRQYGPRATARKVSRGTRRQSAERHVR